MHVSGDVFQNKRHKVKKGHIEAGWHEAVFGSYEYKILREK
jgi:hypothetical protein